MLIVLLKFLLAHIIGDFVLQSRTMVKRRTEHAGYLLVHVLLHGVVLLAFFAQELSAYGVSIAFIVTAHLAIDSLKIWLENKYPRYPLLFFSLDQLLHISVLVGVVFYSFGVPSLDTHVLSLEHIYLYVIAFLLICVVSPIILRIFFSKWQRELEVNNKKKESLLDAGLMIGILERLLIVFFIQVGFLSGIGFLLAAKSIFRFGDLANAKDTKFTEYILLGSLASFVMAIAIGYALRIALILT